MAAADRHQFFSSAQILQIRLPKTAQNTFPILRAHGHKNQLIAVTFFFLLTSARAFIIGICKRLPSVPSFCTRGKNFSFWCTRVTGARGCHILYTLEPPLCWVSSAHDQGCCTKDKSKFLYIYNSPANYQLQITISSNDSVDSLLLSVTHYSITQVEFQLNLRDKRKTFKDHLSIFFLKRHINEPGGYDKITSSERSNELDDL